MTKIRDVTACIAPSADVHESDTAEVSIPFDVSFGYFLTSDFSDLTSPGTALGEGQQINFPRADSLSDSYFRANSVTLSFSLTAGQFIELSEVGAVLVTCCTLSKESTREASRRVKNNQNIRFRRSSRMRPHIRRFIYACRTPTSRVCRWITSTRSRGCMLLRWRSTWMSTTLIPMSLWLPMSSSWVSPQYAALRSNRTTLQHHVTMKLYVEGGLVLSGAFVCYRCYCSFLS